MSRLRFINWDFGDVIWNGRVAAVCVYGIFQSQNYSAVRHRPEKWPVPQSRVDTGPGEICLRLFVA
jgi:hypothetical protein